MLTKRLLCPQTKPASHEPAVVAEQSRRSHVLVVSPSGRSRRHRAHSLVCGRHGGDQPKTQSGAGRTRLHARSEVDSAGTGLQTFPHTDFDGNTQALAAV